MGRFAILGSSSSAQPLACLGDASCTSLWSFLSSPPFPNLLFICSSCLLFSKGCLVFGVLEAFGLFGGLGKVLFPSICPYFGVHLSMLRIDCRILVLGERISINWETCYDCVGATGDPAMGKS